MNRAMHRMMSLGNAAGVALYRRTGGKVGGTAKGGSKVFLLTYQGRKTGRSFTVPVSFVEHNGTYVVCASGGGMKAEPQWIKNLRATDRAEIELGRMHHRVAVRVLTGAERDRVWREVVLAKHPFFADYETKSGRTIALAELTPVAG